MSGPKRQAADQVGGAVRPEHALFVQVAVVLDDPPVAGMVVIGAVEQGGTDEDVALREGLDGGYVSHS